MMAMTFRPALAIAFLLSASPTVAVSGDGIQTRNEEIESAQIAQLLSVSEGTIVADVGAGGGSWTFRLAARVGAKGRVFATDVRTPQVDGIRAGARARGLQNVTVILGSQEEMGLPANCCDALLLRLVYHAFTDPKQMRDSLRRAMRPNGLVLVIDFRPAVGPLTEEMKDAGLEPVQVVERWQDQSDVFAVLFRKVP